MDFEYKIEKETGKVYNFEQYTERYFPELPDLGVLRLSFDNLSNLYNYSSKAETLEHIKRVNELLGKAAIELIKRGNIHDNSKLETPELELFDKYTPILKDLKFGSEEYKQSLEELKPALDHHYFNNSHHPQYYSEGIDGMDLFDIIEMFFDWAAASERTKEGNIEKSIGINKERFGISDQLERIFKNTVKHL